MRVSYSNIDQFREWRADDEQDLPALIARLRGEGATEPMLRGRAFARCLEKAAEGDSHLLQSDGFLFSFEGDFEIPHFPLREARGEKDYGGVTVAVRCDRLLGKLIVDDKSTEQPFDAEHYLAKYQYRYYLDIFNADRFLWNVWEMKLGDGERTYVVRNLHKLEQYRYPGMEEECRELALEFKAFAERWLPGFPYQPIQPPPKPTLKEQLRESVKMEPIWEMKPTRGRNLIAVGWADGILRCAFAAKEGRRFYSYRNVPEAEYVKLLKSPFPDRLFTSNIKAKFEVVKEAA